MSSLSYSITRLLCLRFWWVRGAVSYSLYCTSAVFLHLFSSTLQNKLKENRYLFLLESKVIAYS